MFGWKIKIRWQPEHKLENVNQSVLYLKEYGTRRLVKNFCY